MWAASERLHACLHIVCVITQQKCTAVYICGLLSISQLPQHSPTVYIPPCMHAQSRVKQLVVPISPSVNPRNIASFRKYWQFLDCLYTRHQNVCFSTRANLNATLSSAFCHDRMYVHYVTDKSVRNLRTRLVALKGEQATYSLPTCVQLWGMELKQLTMSIVSVHACTKPPGHQFLMVM